MSSIFPSIKTPSVVPITNLGKKSTTCDILHNKYQYVYLLLANFKHTFDDNSKQQHLQPLFRDEVYICFRPPYWIRHCKTFLSVTLISIYDLQNAMWHDKSTFTVLNFPRTTPMWGWGLTFKNMPKITLDYPYNKLQKRLPII